MVYLLTAIIVSYGIIISWFIINIIIQRNKKVEN